MPLAMYFDFESTAPTNNCFDPEQKKIFVMFYAYVLTESQKNYYAKKLGAFIRAINKD